MSGINIDFDLAASHAYMRFIDATGAALVDAAREKRDAESDLRDALRAHTAMLDTITFASEWRHAHHERHMRGFYGRKS